MFRFDEDTGSVDSGGPGYPRNTGQWWFGCRADTPRKLRKQTAEDRNKIKGKYFLDLEMMYGIQRSEHRTTIWVNIF